MLNSFFYAVLRLVDGVAAASSFGVAIAALIFALAFLTESGSNSNSQLHHLTSYVNTVTKDNKPKPIKIISLNFFFVLFILFAYNVFVFSIMAYILVKGQRDYIYKLNEGVDPYKWALVGADMIVMSFMTTLLGLNISIDSWVWNTVSTAVIPIILYFMDKQLIDKERQKPIFLMLGIIILTQIIIFIMNLVVRGKDVHIPLTVWLIIISYFLYSIYVIVFSYVRAIGYVDKSTADVGMIVGSTVYRIFSSALIMVSV